MHKHYFIYNHAISHTNGQKYPTMLSPIAGFSVKLYSTYTTPFKLQSTIAHSVITMALE